MIGVLPGFFRRLDRPLMRFTDLFLALPVLPLLMVSTMPFRESLRTALGLEAGTHPILPRWGAPAPVAPSERPWRRACLVP